MTNTHISPLSCTMLAAAALALASCGAARADTAAKFKPTAANLKHFVLAQGDLPDGYKRDDFMVSRSPGGCVGHEGNSAAERSYKRTLRALGFRRCASAEFSKEDHTQSAEELTTELTGEYGSEAILMRDRRAAGKALPILRRMLLKSLTRLRHRGALHPGPGPRIRSPARHPADLRPRALRKGHDHHLCLAARASRRLGHRGPPPDDPDGARTLELARKIDSRIAA